MHRVGRGKWMWEDEWRRLRAGYMVDGLPVLIQNRTKKPPAIALSGVGKCWKGESVEGETGRGWSNQCTI
jgi:hypothetical protein